MSEKEFTEFLQGFAKRVADGAARGAFMMIGALIGCVALLVWRVVLLEVRSTQLEATLVGVVEIATNNTAALVLAQQRLVFLETNFVWFAGSMATLSHHSVSNTALLLEQTMIIGRAQQTAWFRSTNTNWWIWPPTNAWKP